MDERRWVVLDVGETLIDETRFWATWADVLGVSRLTFMASLGAVLARGQDHRDVFLLFGEPDWHQRVPDAEARHGGFASGDLYPDALRCITGLRAAGCGVAVVANQPAVRDQQLRALGIEPDIMAMSDAMGVSKPDPAFFARTLELLGNPAAGSVAYVGDRVDNDVVPAARAGMRAVWLRRGPWARIQGPPPPGLATLTVTSLDELVARQDELWAVRRSV
jgi:FMN phosphatase YigB (HAD superfamily)